MRSRIDPSAQLMSLARLQAGALSRQQALGLGMRPSSIIRLVDQGHWARLFPGMFSVGPAVGMTWLWAGLIEAGPLSVVTGSWALHLDGFIPEPPLPVTILSPRHCRNLDEIRFVRRESRGRHEPSRGPVEVALLDHWPDTTQADFISLVNEVLFHKRTTLPRISAEADSRARVPRRRELRDCLADMGHGVRSPLEAAYLRLVERPHGLPAGRRQVEVGGYVVDVLHDEFCLAVETDGRRGHVGDGAFRDMARDNALAALGIDTLRFGWSDVTRTPCAVAGQVARALMVRGWPGPFTPCPSCVG